MQGSHASPVATPPGQGPGLLVWLLPIISVHRFCAGSDAYPAAKPHGQGPGLLVWHMPRLVSTWCKAKWSSFFCGPLLCKLSCLPSITSPSGWGRGTLVWLRPFMPPRSCCLIKLAEPVWLTLPIAGVCFTYHLVFHLLVVGGVSQ